MMIPAGSGPGRCPVRRCSVEAVCGLPAIPRGFASSGRNEGRPTGRICARAERSPSRGPNRSPKSSRTSSFHLQPISGIVNSLIPAPG